VSSRLSLFTRQTLLPTLAVSYVRGKAKAEGETLTQGDSVALGNANTNDLGHR